MKVKHRDLIKSAWSSRLTAPILRVNLTIQCHQLPKKDLLSQADSFCVLWQVPNGYIPASDSYSLHKNGNSRIGNIVPSKLPSQQETERGRTEVARGCVDPLFDNSFELDYKFHEEQTFIIRVYNEDLRYATDLKEHDYLGGCMFTLGQLMGAKGCTIPKRLGPGKSFMIITGQEIVETREVLEFRFSCQDLDNRQSIIDQSRVLDKSNPYFRMERLNKEDQSWEVVWKSEVIKDSLNPTWMLARLPLQLLCNGNQKNPIRVTIWDYEKHSSQHYQMGFVESTVEELVTKSQEGIPVFMVMKERRKLFGGSKLKRVGLLKVLRAAILNIPSMLQYLSGGCSLDIVMVVDCTTTNENDYGSKNDISKKGLHYSESHWLNDYQAGIHKFGSILENFARGKHSGVWGFGAEEKGKVKEYSVLAEDLCSADELLHAYDTHVAGNPYLKLGDTGLLESIVKAGMFRALRATQKRQCYQLLTIFTAGDMIDVKESIDAICTAAEDSPMSIIIVGVGNRDFSAVKRLCSSENERLRDSRGVPISRDILQFVSFKQFSGNATEVVAEALKDIPEQFVQYFTNNGTAPNPPTLPSDFVKIAEERTKKIKKTSYSQGSRQRKDETSISNRTLRR